MIPSGSANKIRQGTNIRTFRQLFGSAMRRITMGDSVSIRLSGTLPPTLGEYGSHRIVAFDDSSAGISSERIGNIPGYRVYLDHSWSSDIYGQGQTNETFNHNNMFVDSDPPNLSGSIHPMIERTSAAKSGSLPLSLRFKTIKNLGQLDGVIEVFPIRPKIDLSFRNLPPSFPNGTVKAENFFGIKAEMESQDTVGEFSEHRGMIVQYESSKSPTVLAYNDNRTYESTTIQTSRRITSTLRYNKVSATVSEPNFQDTDLQSDSKYDFAYTNDGFTPTFTGNANIKNQIYTMTASVIQDFDGMPGKSTSTKAGWTYAVSNVGGPRMGTDSIAFGGLKK